MRSSRISIAGCKLSIQQNKEVLGANYEIGDVPPVLLISRPVFQPVMQSLTGILFWLDPDYDFRLLAPYPDVFRRDIKGAAAGWFPGAFLENR